MSYKRWTRFRTTLDFDANISGTDQAINKQKTALSTTTFSTFNENNLENFSPLTKNDTIDFEIKQGLCGRQVGIPVYSDHAIAAYFTYFAKMRISHIFPHFQNFEYLFMHLEYLFMHKFAKFAHNRIFPHMRSHFVQRKHTRTRHLRHIFP